MLRLWELAKFLKISKGQGNYEALSGQTNGIFFLLKAKCDVVARDVGVPAPGRSGHRQPGRQSPQIRQVRAIE
ncbi:MAG: ARMT1-like domain-containing protein [Desulfobacterales bacterium]